MRVRVLVSVLGIALVAIPLGAAELGPALREALEARGLDPATVVDPLGVTPEMAEWARAVTRGNCSQLARLHRLQVALFDPGQFPFEYDRSLNLTAAEAFHQRRGNCLAFTVLFVALGRSVGVPVQLYRAERVLRVAREEDLVVLNRHVVAGLPLAAAIKVFDFQVDSEIAYGHFEPLPDRSASAMYHTNIGVRLLRDGDLDPARRHLEIATLLDPALASAWVNLGVARRRGGDVEGAMSAYAQALVAEPGNASALTNIASIHRAAGREGEARAALAAAAQEGSTAFSLVSLADIQLARGELDDARRSLLRARRSGGAFPEVYEGLARWAELDGRLDKAQEFRQRAAELRQGQGLPATEPKTIVAAKGATR